MLCGGGFFVKGGRFSAPGIPVHDLRLQAAQAGIDYQNADALASLSRPRAGTKQPGTKLRMHY